MTKLSKITMASMVAFGLGGSSMAVAEEGFAQIKDHKQLASLYEQKAAEQTTLISEHERMMDSDFMRQNPSATAQAEMRKHCSEIITKAKALNAELLTSAQWHRKQ